MVVKYRDDLPKCNVLIIPMLLHVLILISFTFEHQLKLPRIKLKNKRL